MSETQQEENAMSGLQTRKVGIKFGALAAPIAEQLEQQGSRLRSPDVTLVQDWADAIARLSIAGILTEAETHRARGRIMKRLDVVDAEVNS